MPQLPSTHLDKAIIPEGWTNWSGCQGSINLSFGLYVLTATIHQSTNHHGKPPTTHTPSHTLSGENNNRRILRNKASIYIVPNRTNAFDLHICADQRCSDVYCTRTWLQPLWSREVYSLLGRLYFVPVLSTVESDSLETTDGFHHCSSNSTIRSSNHRLSIWCTCARNGFRHFPPAAQPTETLPFEGFRSNRPQLISTE